MNINTLKSKDSKFAKKIEKLSQNSIRKSKFCSIVSELLKSNNNNILKKPIIDTITNYLSISEQLSSRVVCKQWDEVLKRKISCLKKENIYTKTNNINNIFDNSDQKFSFKVMYFWKGGKVFL